MNNPEPIDDTEIGPDPTEPVSASIPLSRADDDPDDGTEGHRLYAKNVGVSFDVAEPTPPDATEPEAADTDGADDDPDDGTEGHKAYARNVGVSFDVD